MNTDNDKIEGKAGVNSDSEHDQEKLGEPGLLIHSLPETTADAS